MRYSRYVNVNWCSCVFVCYLRASRLENTISALRGHTLYNPGPQSFFDEANVRQQLSKLPLQTRNLLQELQTHMH